jgi:hypothetical protein
MSELTGNGASATLTVTVTANEPAYPGLYLWKYELTNNDVSDPLYPGAGLIELSVIFAQQIGECPGNYDTNVFDVDLYWDDKKDGVGPYGLEVGTDKFGGIPEGETAAFWFTTSPPPVVEAAVFTGNPFIGPGFGYYLNGPTIGPAPFVTTVPPEMSPATCSPPGNGSNGGGLGGVAPPDPFNPCPSSTAPVRYGDGVLTYSATDLGSAGGGLPWGVTRSWTNGLGYAAGTTLGGGWVMNSAPRLVPSGESLAVVLNGTTAWWFDPDGYGGYAERHPQGTRLTFDPGTDEYVLTDGTGATIRFCDLDAALPYYRQGSFASYTSPAGEGVEVTDRDDAGRMTEVKRVFGTGGSAVTESYLFAYGTTGGAGGKLTSVTLRRKVGSGEWEAVRSVEYGYYGFGAADGNWGDLKLVTVKDGAGAAIDQSYYRYYKSGDANGYYGGLKFAFGPAATA